MDTVDTVLDHTETQMKKTMGVLQDELSTLRTGRASVGILDGVTVEVYGSPMPLNQVANIAAPEPTMLTVKPYDKSNIPDIEKALHRSNLGLNPSSDGELIRLPIPPLNEERRKMLVKRVGEMVEEAKTALRNIRRDGNSAIKELEKDKKISEDQMKVSLDESQKLTDDMMGKIADRQKAKETELMSI